MAVDRDVAGLLPEVDVRRVAAVSGLFVLFVAGFAIGLSTF